MSPKRIWAIVEGKKHDTPFYENLLSDGAGIEAELVECEDILVDGVSAGGKKHGLKVFARLQELGAVQQQNNRTKIDIVLFLDRDDDDYLGHLVPSANVLYTQHMDVEAEIVAAADLTRAIAQSFSIPRAEASQVAPTNALTELADRWNLWITLRLASGACGWGDTRFAQGSAINTPRYGSVAQEKVTSLTTRIQAERIQWGNELAKAEAHVRALKESGLHGRYVKGKWVVPFVIHLVQRALQPTREKVEVPTSTLMTACISSIDYAQLWRRNYMSRLGPVLAR